MRVLVALLVALPLAAAHAVGANAVVSPDGRLALSTESTAYSWPEHPFTEPICFTATNLDDQPIVWHVSLPLYGITGPGGAVYKDHGQFDGTTWDLQSGESFTDCWGARKDPGVRSDTPLCAEPGPYTLWFEHVNAGTHWILIELPFELVGPVGAPVVPVCPIGEI